MFEIDGLEKSHGGHDRGACEDSIANEERHFELNVNNVTIECTLSVSQKSYLQQNCNSKKVEAAWDDVGCNFPTPASTKLDQRKPP